MEEAGPVPVEERGVSLKEEMVEEAKGKQMCDPKHGPR